MATFSYSVQCAAVLTAAALVLRRDFLTSGNLCHCRLRGRAFKGQSILELVCQFAQLAQSARRRIAFQGVHRPPDYTYDLLVAGFFLQLQRFFIQRLQQFLRSLKEELPQFRSTIIGSIRHSLTSTRWYAVPLSRCIIWNFLVTPNKLSAWPTKR